MTPSATCLVYSRATEWLTRVQGYLASTASVVPVDTPARLDAEFERNRGGVLLLDLQTDGAASRLPHIRKAWPQAVVIAFGVPGTDPMLDAEEAGVYAIEDASVERRRLVALVSRAMDHATLAQENQLLRDDTARLATLAGSTQHHPADDAMAPLEVRHFSKALRHFNNVETLLTGLTDELGCALKVSRIGIFCRTREGETYRLRAGLRCIESTAAMDYSEDDPFVRWLTVYAHVVSKANLDHVKDPTERLMLSRTLDQFGAEIIVPLQGRDRLIGWLFVGHLSTGFPFAHAHVENLIEITEYLSTTLENALLYEEVAIQKTLAETLLHSMPTGIIAVDEDGVVRWFNDTAQQMLGTTSADALGRPIEFLGSRFADALRRTLRKEGLELAEEWVDADTKRSVAVRTQRLMSRSRCLGAVAMVQDTTDRKLMKEKQDRLDRATFWAELAASMSHEVRNPLVAIKTFAQLLPERYEDPEFQTQFRELVSKEVDRLNGIIDQISDFANPPALEFKPLDVRPCIEKSLAATLLDPAAGGVSLRTDLAEDLPDVKGDGPALVDAFNHILRNALEAMSRQSQGAVIVTARPALTTDRKQAVGIYIQDNGPGIPPEMRDKVFSPFCTTKARGLGLGLPIVKRTVVDHNGQVEIASTPQGTCVSILLPAVNDSEIIP